MADRATVITPEFRISYPALIKPEVNKLKPGDPAKYAFTMLIPKTADLSSLKKLAADAIAAKFGAKPPANLRPTLRDGDAEGKFPGYYFAKVKTAYKPIVVSPSGKQVLTDEEIAAKCYPGAWMRAKVSAFAYDQSGNRGVSFSPESLQWLRDGEPLVARRDATNDFESAGSDDALKAPAAAAGSANDF